MHFIRYWKPYFLSIITVGFFFIAWDVFFTYQQVWGFNDEYLIGLRILGMPLEEYLFFLLIPYASVFIHYSLEYFYPRIMLSEKATSVISWILFLTGLLLTVLYHERLYTFVCLGLFTILLLFQLIYKWEVARRFYLSFIIIFIPFYFVNGALTGSYSAEPVVYYDNNENLGIRLGTIPVEDSFYCFALLYSITLLFEYLKTKFPVQP